MPRVITAALVWAAMAIAASGCGGGTQSSGAEAPPAISSSATTSTSAETPTTSTSQRTNSRANLLLQVDAVCEKWNARLKSTVVHNLAEQKVVLPKIGSFEEEAAAEANKIITNTSLRKPLHELVAGLHALAQASIDYGRYLKENHETQARRIGARREKRKEELTALARKNGLTACGELR